MIPHSPNEKSTREMKFGMSCEKVISKSQSLEMGFLGPWVGHDVWEGDGTVLMELGVMTEDRGVGS